MDNYPIKTHSRTDLCRSPHLMDTASHSGELLDDHSGNRYKIWFGVVVIASLYLV
jgi:hypothetical protein